MSRLHLRKPSEIDVRCLSSIVSETYEEIRLISGSYFITTRIS